MQHAETRPHEAADAIKVLLTLAREPLAAPTAPGTRNGKPIRVREAYDREFERYLVRMFLEQHPDAVAKFLRRSLMPEGLLDAFTPEQVSDLFAYLKSLK